MSPGLASRRHRQRTSSTKPDVQDRAMLNLIANQPFNPPTASTRHPVMGDYERKEPQLQSRPNHLPRSGTPPGQAT
jgi:hypothetical protein